MIKKYIFQFRKKILQKILSIRYLYRVFKLFSSFDSSTYVMVKENIKFPFVNIIRKLPNKSSLFETALVAANDELVDMYLNNKIKYTDINKKLLKFLNKKEFIKLRQIQPNMIDEIIKLSHYVRLKINPLSVYR